MAARKGFEFCVMVVGEAGVGKTTLWRTLFSEGVEEETLEHLEHDHGPAAARAELTTVVKAHTVTIEEARSQLKLTLVDTPGSTGAFLRLTLDTLPRRLVLFVEALNSARFPLGFGDSIDIDQCWVPIVEYIDGAYSQYLEDESKIDRTRIRDRRVHAVIYCINPIAQGLRPIDVQTMLALHNKVKIALFRVLAPWPASGSH